MCLLYVRGRCANLYSRGNAAMVRELQLRRDAVSIVREFIGDAEWRDVVPLQLDGPPTWGWLGGAPPAVFDGGETDDEE